MNKLQKLKKQRKRLIAWMDMCDAHFSVKANEELYEIEQKLELYKLNTITNG